MRCADTLRARFAAPALAGVFVAALLLLTGCASPQVATLARQWPADLPAHAELHNVPFLAQTDHACGPAALAMLMQAAGVPMTPEALLPQVYLPERKGSLQIELRVAARRAGLLAYPLEPTVQSVLREVAAGNPVLVFQNLSLPWYPVWHYAVVIGYDRESETLRLHSGLTAGMAMSLSAFERTWARGGYWAMVAQKPPLLPATATAMALAPALVALEPLQAQAARAGYAAALARWPDDRTFLLGAGNTAYALGDGAGALAAFTRAVAVHPDFDYAWNNLAQVLWEHHRLPEALAAIDQALKKAPTPPQDYRDLRARIVAAQAAARPD